MARRRKGLNIKALKHTLDKNIIVSFDARNYVSIIEDNGQVINLKDLEKVFSVLHSSTNYDKK